MTQYKRNGEAVRTLNHAFEHLRPRMQGDSVQGVPANGEALAGSILATLMTDLVEENYRLRRAGMMHVAARV